MTGKLNAMIDKETFEKVYSILGVVTPEDFDCGSICGQACCRAIDTDPNSGMILLPGEDSVHELTDPWLSWEDINPEDIGYPEGEKPPVQLWFVKCKGPEHCKRSKRPIQCRIFPLLPRILKNGKLKIERNNMELPYSCPIIDGNAAIKPEFEEAVKEAFTILLADKDIWDFVKYCYSDEQ